MEKDETIRQALVALFTAYVNDKEYTSIYGIPVEDCLIWLEKQKPKSKLT